MSILLAAWIQPEPEFTLRLFVAWRQRRKHYNKANSTLNLSLVTVKFNTDGSYSETLPTGATLPETWKFLNNEAQTEIINTSGTYTSTIITLADNNFIWQDLTRSGGILAKMINQ